MTFNDYQEATHLTNQYPEDKMLECLVTEIAAEAGEVAGKYNKFLRGDFKNHPNEHEIFKAIIMEEAGDTLWGISELCTYFGITLEQLAEMNNRKLSSRAKRGTIKGEGDDR